MASAVARAYNGGLVAEPPAGVQEHLALYKVPVLVLHPTLSTPRPIARRHGNVIIKFAFFADDTHLIPARNSDTRGDEVSHAKS